MPNNFFTKIIFTLLIATLSHVSMGQSSGTSRKCINKDWQINYNLGFTEFYGDVSSNGYFKKFSGEISFATGISVRKYFSNSFGLGVNLWYSGIRSNKDKRTTGIPTNFHLTGKYFDGNINLLIDFTNLFWGASDRKVSIYGIIGTGYSTWNSTLTDSITGSVRYSGDINGSDVYKKGAFVIPVGLGINYMISNNWALNFEMNLRTIINDDVDVWNDGFKYDQLLYTSIGISYFINKNSKKKPKQVTRREAPIKPVATYDYHVNPNNQNSTAKTTPGVLLIEAPVEKKVILASGILYRVQVFATRNKMPSFNYLRERYNITGDIYENFSNGIYRYSTGSFSTYTEAVNLSIIMKKKGVTDAFVVAYKQDVRINITPEMKK